MATDGGLRVDHVMGLSRLFWIPPGCSPEHGTYVRFAGREMLDVLAMESERAGAIVVGEDLGTVEEGFRHDPSDKLVPSTRLVSIGTAPCRERGFQTVSISVVSIHL